MPLREYLRHHVWEPAGMSSTDFETFGKPLPNQAVGYSHGNGKVVVAKKTNVSSKYPGGGMVSTAEDLVRFAAKLQDGTLVKAETFESMLVPPRLPAPKKSSYGFGFSVSKEPEYGRVVSHSGEIVGACTHLRILRDHGIVVAVISNTREDSVRDVAVSIGKLAMD
ncbi:MAG: hypothetical protein AMXMBFR84_11050 [Candidatus Hydrogenedentota bacterium]